MRMSSSVAAKYRKVSFLNIKLYLLLFVMSSINTKFFIVFVTFLFILFLPYIFHPAILYESSIIDPRNVC